MVKYRTSRPGGEAGESIRGRLSPEVLDRCVTWTDEVVFGQVAKR